MNDCAELAFKLLRCKLDGFVYCIQIADICLLINNMTATCIQAANLIFDLFLALCTDNQNICLIFFCKPLCKNISYAACSTCNQNKLLILRELVWYSCFIMFNASECINIAFPMSIDDFGMCFISGQFCNRYIQSSISNVNHMGRKIANFLIHPLDCTTQNTIIEMMLFISINKERML